MRTDSPPPDIEHKGAALAAAPATAPRAGRAAVKLLDAVVMPTGVPLGGDLIVPGALGRAVAARMPKVTIADDWSRPAGIVRSAVELPAGDPRLPATTPDGSPWPAGVGALLCRVEYIVGTADGRLARDTVRRGGDRQRYTVGFRVLDGEQKGGLRHIRALDLFTISPRLARGGALRVKGAGVVGLEVKDGTGEPGRSRGPVVACGVCGRPAGAVVPGGLADGDMIVCPSCVAEVGDVTRLDGATIPAADLAAADLMLEPELTVEQEYERALADELGYELESDGTVVPAGQHSPARTGRAWTRQAPTAGWGRP